MIRVHYSNRADALVAALQDALQGASGQVTPTTGRGSQQPVTSPALAALAPRIVAVPNGDVAAYLKVEVARRAGIASNFEFPFLERALLDCVPAALRERVLDRPRLHVALMGVLARQDGAPDGAPESGGPGTSAAAASLAPVSGYVNTAEDADEAWLRRFQLANQLAGLFVDYSLTRPGLLAAWRKGESGLPPAWASTESWQRALWRALYVDGPWLTLPDAFERVAPGELELPTALHVFGFSYLARAYYRIFERIGAATHLYLYTFNPCAEYWEDIGADAQEPPFLRRWGRPGRDHTHSLNQLTDGDFDARFTAPTTAPGALQALQSDILQRRPPGRPPTRESESQNDRNGPPRADIGVSVHACPSIAREAEIIAAQIWHLVQSTDDLRFSDIAVLVNPARRDLYQTHLAAAFRAAGGIPTCVVDAPLAGESRAVEAIELLLSLPFGNLGRNDLLRLMTHPNVIARFPDAAPADWLRWADDLAIVRGADKRDHAGTYVTDDRFNWDQGLRRLTLGAFLSAEPDADGAPPRFEFNGGEYLVAPPGQGRGESAARFAALARALIADARECRSARHSLADWAGFVGQLVAAYIEPVDDADERAVSRCRNAVEKLAELDVDGRPVPYRVAYELARSAIASLRVSRGELFSEGVVVSTLAPMRSLPFRALFVAGLSEGEFPAPERANALDLRLAHRQAGDVRPRERDRYTLLETVLAAREQLILSYVARDPQTGDALEPSPLVTEIIEILSDSYLSDEESDKLVVRHPLRRYDFAYFDGSRPDLHPATAEAEQEARAMQLRAELGRVANRAPTALPDIAVDELDSGLAPEQWRALREFLRLCPPPAGARAEVTQVSMYQLRGFLVSPLQASARVLLGLRDDDDEPVTDRIDEPFESAPLTTAVVLRQVLRDALDIGPDANLDELYQRRIDVLELAGEVPTGLYGDLARARHRAILQHWHRNLQRAGLLNERFDHVRFGKAQEHTRVDEIHPPLALSVALPNGKTRRIELVGKTELVCTSKRRSLTAVHGAVLRDEHFIRGFVDQAVLVAAGVIDGSTGPFSATVCPGADGLETRRYPALNADSARAYLENLLAELLGAVHDQLLPLEAIVYARRKSEPVASVVQRALRRDGGKMFTARFGPLRDLTRFAVADDAEAVAERRLGRFLAAEVVEGGA